LPVSFLIIHPLERVVFSKLSTKGFAGEA